MAILINPNERRKCGWYYFATEPTGRHKQGVGCRLKNAVAVGNSCVRHLHSIRSQKAGSQKAGNKPTSILQVERAVTLHDSGGIHDQN